MAISLDSIPRFAAAAALELAHREYGISGEISPLPSERDQNFLIRDVRQGKVVLKIANREDSRTLLDFQHQAMRRVAARVVNCRLQRVLPTLGGEETGMIEGSDGNVHCFRVLGWIEGTVLGNLAVRGPELLESLGTCMAQVDSALHGFAHPAMNRVLQWDLRRADLAFDKVRWVPDRWRGWVERAFLEWQRIDWAALPSGVIHGDGNDHNLLVQDGRVSGLIDFGDMVHSATVCDLAVALAYAMLHQSDPLAAAASVIRGYDRQRPLAPAEQRVLMPLCQARLAVSLCYAAHNRARSPDDAYQVITEGAARVLLERLERYPSEAAFAMVLGACGS